MDSALEAPYEGLDLNTALTQFLVDRGSEVDVSLVRRISSQLPDILSDSLGVESEEIVPYARLKDDLSAESIDHLDISFRIQKNFDLKLTPDHFSDFYYPDGSLDGSGRFTLRGLENLDMSRPFRAFMDAMHPLDMGKFYADLSPADLTGGYNVLGLAAYVYIHSLEEKNISSAKN